jgi:hypothetical protein
MGRCAGNGLRPVGFLGFFSRGGFSGFSGGFGRSSKARLTSSGSVGDATGGGGDDDVVREPPCRRWATASSSARRSFIFANWTVSESTVAMSLSMTARWAAFSC